MQADEFDACIGKLAGVFGKSHYPELRVRSLWSALKFYPDGVLSAAVEKLVLSSRSAPLYGDLRDQCDFEVRAKPRAQPAGFQRECDECGGNGVIEMIGYLMERRTTTFGACDRCEQGRANGRGGVTMPVSELEKRGWQVIRRRPQFEKGAMR